MVHVSMNRAVHLARRDKHYEKALKLLEGDFSKDPLSERVWRVDNLIANLEAAYEEGYYAVRGIDCDEDEQNFLKVLELILDSAWAAQAMVRHENLLEEDKSFLNKFLGESIDKISLSERTYNEKGRDILVGIQEMARTVQPAFERVRKENLKTLSEEEQGRYDKTAASLA